MMNDPIVDEVHRTREQILAQYNGDLDAYFKDLQLRTDEAARAGRKVVALPPRRPEGWTEPSKKVG